MSSPTVARSFGLVHACLLLLLAPAGIAHSQQKVRLEPIRISYAGNTLSFLAMFVAKDRGLYAKFGLDAELVQVRPAVAIAALLSGDVDYAEVLGSAIRSASKGAPIRAISITIRAPFFSLAAKPNFKSVRDLRGRSLGVTAIGGTNYLAARLMLQHFGVDPDREMKLISIGEQRLLYEALKIGRVDAVLTAPPFSVFLKREGFSLLAHSADILSIPFVGLSTPEQKIRRNRTQVKSVLKAEIEALRYLRSNPEGTVGVIRKRFGMNEELARESYALVVNAFSRDGKIQPEGVENLLEIEKKDGSIPKTVTLAQVADLTLSEEALGELPGIMVPGVKNQ